MVTRRDELLSQLGITQWAVRRPTVLRGVYAQTLSDQVRLLVITPAAIAADHPLLTDVLRALCLTPAQMALLTPSQASALPATFSGWLWLLGCPPEAIPAHYPQPRISSPPLAELIAQPHAKRALWEQICEQYRDRPADDRQPA